MKTIPLTRFVPSVTCPKCKTTHKSNQFTGAGQENELIMTCDCGLIRWVMPTADSEPTFGRKAAKWLAFAPIRLPWAIIRRIPRTIGIHPDHPHPGKLWATIQMLVGGTIISSIPGAWQFIGSHTEWLWMAPIEWSQAAWSSVASIDYGTIATYAGPTALASIGAFLMAKRGKKV